MTSFVELNAAAGVLFTDAGDRVLMVVPTYKPYLDIPGGYVEPGENPSQAAGREVKEEIGLALQPGRLLVADWWTESIEIDGTKALFIFDGAVLSSEQLDQVHVDGEEISGIRLVKAYELDDVTVPRLANRIRFALDARANSTVHYLEEGQPLINGSSN